MESRLPVLCCNHADGRLEGQWEYPMEAQACLWRDTGWQFWHCPLLFSVMLQYTSSHGCVVAVLYRYLRANILCHETSTCERLYQANLSKLRLVEVYIQSLHSCFVYKLLRNVVCLVEVLAGLAETVTRKRDMLPLNAENRPTLLSRMANEDPWK